MAEDSEAPRSWLDFFTEKPWLETGHLGRLLLSLVSFGARSTKGTQHRATNPVHS